jgi:TolB-like protein
MPTHVTRFGIFEVDAQAGELRKDGRRLKVSGQPFEILSALLQHPGKLITRDELRSRLWPDSTVDFDHGLNAAINKLRASLGDFARRPRFIETLPRRGYRFIAPIARPKLMLAVLPFKNLNRDPEENYFSDGLTQELITHLALLDPQRLGVIAQTSVMQYRQTNKPVHEIGHELAVDYILEGSVRRFGKRVRVAVQLIHAEDETCLWAQTSENHLRDILSLENNIAQIVAKHIQLQVRVGNRPSAPPLEPQAHEAYLRGRHQLRKLTREGAEKAIVHFEESIRKDSACAVAYVGLAQAYVSLTTFYLAPLAGR